MNQNKCSVTVCTSQSRRKAFGASMCEAHYNRSVNYGTPVLGPEVRVGRPQIIHEGDTCREGGCSNQVKAVGLCNAHYVAARRARLKTERSFLPLAS